MYEYLSLDSMMNELQFFLKSKARNLPCPARSLVFKLENKNNLKITDADKKSFKVEEFFLESFRAHFSTSQTPNVPNLLILDKYVKINGWEFELELTEKKHPQRRSCCFHPKQK
jgi:hypothetical protein